MFLMFAQTGQTARRAPWLAAMACAALLAGCASAPPPNDAMARAQAQLQAAREAGAADADPVDMDFATAKFQQAQAAMTAEKYELAAHLAAESHADAQLAFTKARLASLRDRISKQAQENARLRAQLLDKKQQMQQSQRAFDQGGTELPEQVLPQPAAPSTSAPAPATSAPALMPVPANNGQGGGQ